MNKMFNELTEEENKTYIQWAKDNYHSKVGISGTIKALWHPVVRKEMRRQRSIQSDKVRQLVSLMVKKEGAPEVN